MSTSIFAVEGPAVGGDSIPRGLPGVQEGYHQPSKGGVVRHTEPNLVITSEVGEYTYQSTDMALLYLFTSLECTVDNRWFICKNFACFTCNYKVHYFMQVFLLQIVLTCISAFIAYNIITCTKKNHFRNAFEIVQFIYYCQKTQ